MISIFLKQMKRDMKFTEIKKIINDIEKLKDCVYKESLLTELKKLDFKRNKFTMERIRKSIPVMIEILQSLMLKLDLEEFEKASIMASSVHNYPGFLIFEYKCKPEDFWEEHLQYYSKTYGEDFLKRWEHEFKEIY